MIALFEHLHLMLRWWWRRWRWRRQRRRCRVPASTQWSCIQTKCVAKPVDHYFDYRAVTRGFHSLFIIIIFWCPLGYTYIYFGRREGESVCVCAVCGVCSVLSRSCLSSWSLVKPNVYGHFRLWCLHFSYPIRLQTTAEKACQFIRMHSFRIVWFYYTHIYIIFF